MLRRLSLALALVGLVGVNTAAADTDIQRIADALNVSQAKQQAVAADQRADAIQLVPLPYTGRSFIL